MYLRNKNWYLGIQQKQKYLLFRIDLFLIDNFIFVPKIKKKRFGVCLKYNLTQVLFLFLLLIYIKIEVKIRNEYSSQIYLDYNAKNLRKRN